MCNDIHTKFHKDWSRHLKVYWGDTQTHRQQGDLISLLSCFQNKESRLKIINICLCMYDKIGKSVLIIDAVLIRKG
jgi:hypothetical protein